MSEKTPICESLPTAPKMGSSPRWFIAACAVLTHLCLGSVYAWSIFVAPIQSSTGWGKPQVTWAFSTAIAALGFTAAFGARLMTRLAPRVCVTTAGLLFGAGLCAAGFATRLHSLPLLYIGFGVMGGMGLGMGYAPPVAMMLKWFPDRRGLATGMAVSGFGGGALLASQFGEALLPRFGCDGTFWILASIYAPVILLSAQMMRLPPADWNPEGWIPQVKLAGGHDEMTLSAALADRRFWLIWSIFYMNIAAGIMLIALAKPMGQEVVKLTGPAAAWMVAIMGVTNGTGRLAWSAASDYLGRTRTFLTMLIIEVALFAVMGSTTTAALFMGCIWIILSCYGGGFALTPALIADTFGGRHAGSIYGAALTAWSVAALTGPPLAAMLHEWTRSYSNAIYTASGLLVLASLLTLVLSRSRLKC